MLPTEIFIPNSQRKTLNMKSVKILISVHRSQPNIDKYLSAFTALIKS